MIPSLQNLQVGSDTGVVRVESENRVGKWLWGEGWFDVEDEDLKKKRMDYLKSFDASKKRLSTRFLWREVQKRLPPEDTYPFNPRARPSILKKSIHDARRN